MTEFLLHVLTALLAIVGIHEATREEMVGERLGVMSRYLLGEWWSKPVTECVTCMASVWGSMYFCVFHVCVMCDTPSDPVRSWMVFILALAGAGATYGNIFYRES